MRLLVLLCAVCAACGPSLRAAGPAPGRITSGFVDAGGGVRLHYEIRGSAPDTLVVLHGGPAGELNYLAADLEPLLRTHTLVLYDQRGSGRSTLVLDTAALNAGRHVADLDAVRRHLGLERLTLLGHSWGGILAGLYAAAQPERVDRMILHAPGFVAMDPFARQAFQALGSRIDGGTRARIDSLMRAWQTSADPVATCRAASELFTLRVDFADPAAPRRMKAPLCEAPPETLRQQPRVRAAILRSLGMYDLRPGLGGVRAPVLVVHGAQDWIPLDSSREWARAFGDARILVIDRAAHFAHVEQPSVFFQAVGEFLHGRWPAAAQAPAASRGDGGR